MASIGIFTFSVIWLTLVSCSQVRGRLAMEKHVALEAKAQKTGNGSEMEVHALNSNNSDERVIFSEKLAPKSMESLPTKIPRPINIYAPEDDFNSTQHWAVYQTGTGTSEAYFGAKSTLVVYGYPDLEVGRGTRAGIWIANGLDGPLNQLNVIQAGWQVLPELYGDSLTHFFIYWTADGYQSTGCYNLKCVGFVLTNNSGLIPGGVIQPVSIPGGPQFELSIKIFKGRTTGYWWLLYGLGENVTPIGYWPTSLFTSLVDVATRVDFGGHVSFQPNGVSPPMGSGYFPSDSKAAYFKDTAYIRKNGDYFAYKNPPQYVDNRVQRWRLLSQSFVLQKTGNGSEMEVHALNSNNSDERVIFSEKLAPKTLESLPTKISPSINIYAPEDNSNYIQHWAVYQTGTGTSTAYYGAKSTLVVYGYPDLEVGRGTRAGIWVANGVDGPRNQLNVIQAGWQVLPELYGDSLTHFFIHWTADGYTSTGCYNLKCAGFVLTNNSGVIPGTVLHPVSTPGGPQYEISIKIIKDRTTGYWWLLYGHGENVTPIGYWPTSLFTSLADEATRVDFGGHVSFQANGVSPPMGSGHFPTDSKAAYFKDTAYIKKNGDYFVYRDPPQYVDNRHCYNLAEFNPDRFNYGGPGGCDT